jgi:hypothetical protein
LTLTGSLGLVELAFAQWQPPATDAEASVFPVGPIELVYARPDPELPHLDELLPVQVALRRTELGWAAPREGEPTELLLLGDASGPAVELEASGLARVLRVLVGKIHERGLYGVDVRPSSSDIDLETERDLRPPGRTTLQIVVRIGRITQVRTIAVGERIKSDWKIDHELHTRIRQASPLQPAGSANADSTDLLDRRALEDYLFRLNRYSGRRVEAALSPAVEPGGVVLDYRILEARPWFVYGQLSNTGTRRTNPWQTRLGAVARQLTNRDDELSLEYLNAGLDDVNAFSSRYQAPFFGAERPDWMKSRTGDPGWIRWLPRDRLPWWGMDRLRWELDFSYGKFKADRSRTLGDYANDIVNSDQFQYGGRLIYEAFQHRDFFIDVWTGLRFRNLEVDNRSGPRPASGNQLFVIPRLGVHAQRINQVSNFGLDLSIEGSVNDTNQEEIENLGRVNADGRYAVLDFDLGYSTFLEPIIRPSAWRDPSSEFSSTLAHEIAFGVHGQYAFDYRLVPQASQVVGGLYSVRGYDQSVAVGDTVVVGSLEYRFHIPRALPVEREPLRIPYLGDFRAAPQQVYGRPDWDFILRAFVDVGRAIRNGDAAIGATEPDETLIGAGLGAELTFRSNFRARVDWGNVLKGTSDSIAHPAEVGDYEINVLFSLLY